MTSPPAAIVSSHRGVSSLAPQCQCWGAKHTVHGSQGSHGVQGNSGYLTHQSLFTGVEENFCNSEISVRIRQPNLWLNPRSPVELHCGQCRRGESGVRKILSSPTVLIWIPSEAQTRTNFPIKKKENKSQRQARIWLFCQNSLPCSCQC